ncbi:MAG: NAD(P)/FAD-dependent oxidoreductase [candidate division NC10 bacterium]|nr:NAD(P)/FAD-dependent oxidoreductase [candidate division NC10 bacterium]
MWDVIVVGAGPAGCTAAALLSRAGLRVTLLDKSAAPPPKVCGEYLSPGCLPILDGIGLLSSLRDAGARPLNGMVIHTAGGRTLEATYPRDGGIQGLPARGLAIRRALLDPLLLDTAIKQGAEFAPNFQVSDLVWKDGRVAGVRGRRRGQMINHRARLVIGADGRNSAVARRMGTVQPHPWLDKIALVGYFAGVERSGAVGEIFLGRDLYGILNPITPELTNIGLVVNRRDFAATADLTRLFLETAATVPGLRNRLARARAVQPPRCLGPLAYRSRRLAARGALLIGDAAGFLDPFTGEGIYAALRSAEIAVECVVSFLLTDCTAPADPQDFPLAWRREFLPKWRFCAKLQYAVRHPALAECLVSHLARHPALLSRLMAGVGDLIPARELAWHRLLFRR